MWVVRAIRQALIEIWGHKVRSILTLSCVLLGVVAVVLTVGYTRGLTYMWKMGLKEQGGLEKLNIFQSRPPFEQKHLGGISPGHRLEDAQAILRNCLRVARVSPSVNLEGMEVSRGRKDMNPELEGITPEHQTIERFEVVKGRFIADNDNAIASQVAVIGHQVVQELFLPDEEPLGQSISIKGIPFTVVGVLKNYEVPGQRWNPAWWKNEVCFIPIYTAMRKLQGSINTTGMDVQLSDTKFVDESVQQIENVLQNAHRGIRDFNVRTRSEWSDSIEKQEREYVTAGAAIALITILIGGIGIMNLMLASINERTREIGIRKSIGATSLDIFFQFGVESITLCVIGGLLGVVFGQYAIYLIREHAESSTKPIFNNLGIFMGFGASVVIGVLAGIYPAIKAARFDPIEALRAE